MQAVLEDRVVAADAARRDRGDAHRHRDAAVAARAARGVAVSWPRVNGRTQCPSVGATLRVDRTHDDSSRHAPGRAPVLAGRLAFVGVLSVRAGRRGAQGELNLVLRRRRSRGARRWRAAFLKETGIAVNITLKDAAGALAQRGRGKDPIPSTTSGMRATATAQLRAAETRPGRRIPVAAAAASCTTGPLRQAEQSKWRTVGVLCAVRSASATTARRSRTSSCRSRAAGPISREPEYRDELQIRESDLVAVGYATLATLVQVFRRRERVRAAERRSIGT